jgi:hypothetical protein
MKKECKFARLMLKISRKLFGKTVQNSEKLCILRKNGQNIAKQRKIGRFWTRKNIAQKCTMHIPASK